MTTAAPTRVALVTGAARNIGRAIALALGGDGVAVTVAARRSADEAASVAREIEAGGGKALVQLGDVADEGVVTAMVEATVARFGRLDILVNNAAERPEAPIDAIDLAAWRRVLATVLDGAFLMVKAALPHLRASGAGAIVNVGGLSAHTGAAHRVHVVTAKAGLVGLTRALAHELAPDGITVNCVSPGLIDTARKGAEPGHHVGRKSLLGRRGQPQEIAAAVRYLASAEARYVTGQVLHVNGGLYLGG